LGDSTVTGDLAVVDGSITWAGGKGVADATGISHTEDANNYWTVKPNASILMDIAAGVGQAENFCTLNVLSSADGGLAIVGTANQGGGIGLKGVSTGSEGVGVYGIGTGSTGTGVYAYAGGTGTNALIAEKHNNGGAAIYAYALGTGSTALIAEAFSPATVALSAIGKVGLGAAATPVSLVEIQGGLTTTGAVLTLSSQEPSTVANDVLGRINFRAALDASGTDANAIGAAISAVASDTFSASVNKTSLRFYTGASGDANERMRICYNGNVGLNVSDDPVVALSISGKVAMHYDSNADERGMLIKVINRTGETSVKGTLVSCSTTADNQVVKQANEFDTIGVIYEAGIAEGYEMWIWANGSICQVLYKNSVAATRGNILIAADTDGRAIDIANPGSGLPSTDTHFKECGHVLQSQSAGTNVLVLAMLHFN
jgi:hypothetical protein